MSETISQGWQNNRTLVYAWLLIFFPVGLYAVWTGSLFDKQKKWMISGVVAGVIVVFGGGAFLDFLLAFVCAPLAVYLCWRDPAIGKSTTYKFGAGAAVILVLVLFGSANRPGPYIGGSCAAVQTSGNCTYYRDSDCNVIGQMCQ